MATQRVDIDADTAQIEVLAPLEDYDLWCSSVNTNAIGITTNGPPYYPCSDTTHP